MRLWALLAVAVVLRAMPATAKMRPLPDSCGSVINDAAEFIPTEQGLWWLLPCRWLGECAYVSRAQSRTRS